MIVVMNRIPVALGFGEAFEERFNRRTGFNDRVPGFIRNEILRPLKSDSYIVKTYWCVQEDFERWTQSDSFRQIQANRQPVEMLTGPNVLEIHEVVQQAGKLVITVHGVDRP